MGILRQSDWQTGDPIVYGKQRALEESQLATEALGRKTSQLDLDKRLEDLEQTKYENKEMRSRRNTRTSEHAERIAKARQGEYEADDFVEDSKNLDQLNVAATAWEAGDADTAAKAMERLPEEIQDIVKQAPDEMKIKILQQLRTAGAEDLQQRRQIDQYRAQGEEQRKGFEEQGAQARETQDEKYDREDTLQKDKITSAEKIAADKDATDIAIADMGTGAVKHLFEMRKYAPKIEREIRELLLRAKVAKDQATGRGGKTHADTEQEKLDLGNDLTSQFVVNMVSSYGGGSQVPGKWWGFNTEGEIDPEKLAKVPGLAAAQEDVAHMINGGRSAEEIQRHLNNRYVLVDEEHGFLKMPQSKNGAPYVTPGGNIINGEYVKFIAKSKGMNMYDAAVWVRDILIKGKVLSGTSDWDF